MVCFWLAAASFMAARGSLLTAEGDEPRPIKAAPRIMRTLTRDPRPRIAGLLCFGKQAPSYPIPEHGMGSRTTGYIARRLAGAACRVSQACDHTDVCACIRGLIAAGAAIDLSAWMEVPQNGFWAGRFFPISPASGRYGRGTPQSFQCALPGQASCAR